MRAGFIGAGKMGAAMIANLLRAQLPVTVYDIRPQAVSGLVALGATSAGSPAEVAAASDVIGVSVVDDAQVLSVMSGPMSVLDGLRPGSAVLIHATVRPETCRRVAELCQSKGADCLDVMVSGFPEKAESGELTLMVGGAASVAARCEPYLTAIGARWFHAGPVGAGAAAKLANNLMWKFNMVGAFEGLAVARAGGVDPAVMASIALASSGQSEALRRWQEIGGRDKHSPAIWEGGITPGYDRIMTEAVDIARAQGTDLPAASAIIDLTREPPPEAGAGRARG